MEQIARTTLLHLATRIRLVATLALAVLALAAVAMDRHTVPPMDGLLLRARLHLSTINRPSPLHKISAVLTRKPSLLTRPKALLPHLTPLHPRLQEVIHPGSPLPTPITITVLR